MGCLDHLFQATLPPSATIDIFLVDDGSPDLLGRNVKEKYPQVNVINGNSALFWIGGMHKAWEESVKTKEFQYFLWLNDKTHIYSEAIVELLSDDFKMDRNL